MPSDVGGAVITFTQIMILGMVTAISLAVLMWLVNYTKLVGLCGPRRKTRGWRR